MAIRWKPNYSSEELTVLVEDYNDLSRYYRHKQYIQVRLMDVELALRKLSKPIREAIVLCGMYQLSPATAGAMVDAHRSTMWRRYQKGKTELLDAINGNK